MGIYFFIGLVVVVFIFYTIVGNRDHKNKLKKLSESRPQISKEEYIEYYSQKGYRKEYIEEVYDHIENYISYEWFSMHPEDNLLEDYEIDHEDLEDILMEILKKNKLKLPEKDTIERLSEKYAKNHSAEHLLEVIGVENGA